MASRALMSRVRHVDPQAVGSRELALICCGVASAWSVVAFSLGRLHDAMPNPVGRLPTG